MEVQLGKPVYCQNGTRLGTVDRVVIDPKSMSVVEFIVHRGLFFTEDRIVERQFVDRVAEDGSVHLRVTADVAEQFPLLATRRYVMPSYTDLRDSPDLDAASSYDAGAILWRSDYKQYGHTPPTRSILEMAPTEALQIEVETNLPTGTVVIDRGTEVRTSDNHDLGSVEEVIYENGNITAIVVESGLIVHRPVSIPASWIQSITHDHVRLSISADEARNKARAALTQGVTT